MKTLIKIYFYTISLFFLLCSSQYSLAADEQVNSELFPIYNSKTQQLSIPKLGVPSGNAGYAYQVEMSLFSNDPLGFIVSSISKPTAIAADEGISAIYQSETHTIFFPRVFIIDENDNTSELKDIGLTLSGDPFVWFYSSQAQ